ncbi:MAG: hypothetical protein KDK25_15595, partial [Leptospiraceae bacterium]|nr:hypothetical protein [Leptospiraceae bacterium]
MRLWTIGTVALAAAGLVAVAALSPATQYVWGQAPRINIRWFQTYEWILLILSLLFSGLVVFRHRAHSSKGAPQSVSGPANAASPDSDGFLSGPEFWSDWKSTGSRIPLLLSYAMLFCGFFYTGIYYESTYQGFFLQEHDFLNIAA